MVRNMYTQPRHRVTYCMTRTVAKHVEANLVQRVKGYVSVHISGDYLVCDIQHSGICYRFTQPQIAQLCFEGASSELIASTIYKDYRVFINKKFFK